MPRPKKCRRICGGLPAYNRFGPKGKRNNASIVMSIDEFETIRLIDYNNMMQEEAAQRLNVARTTAQAIYTAARKKIAQALIEGKDLVIEGGDIEICNHRNLCSEKNEQCKNE